MANFDNGVSSPSGASFSAPLLNFAQFSNWASDYQNGVVGQQQKQANDQELQLNQQRIAQGQRQQQLAEAFQAGGALDDKGNFDPQKAQALFARFGVLDGITQVAPMVQRQQAANTPEWPTSAGVPGSNAPSSIPAKPLPVPNAPQGDAAGSVISRVTDALPPERTDKIGVIAGNIARALKVDPNAPLTPEQAKKLDAIIQGQGYGPPANRSALTSDNPRPLASPSANSRVASAFGDMPPSASGASPAPQMAQRPTLPPSGSPQAPRATLPTTEGAPIGAGSPPQPPTAPSSPRQGRALTPQWPLPVDPKTNQQFTDPMQAILSLRARADDLESQNPDLKTKADGLRKYADAIEKSIAPQAVSAGTAILDPRTGQEIYRAPPAAQSRAPAPEVVDKIADGIASGQQPPSLTGLYGMSGPVRASLQDRGFDLARAQLEYKRAEKQVATLNGPQMTRFFGLASSVDKTIDEVRELSVQMDNSGIPLLNRASMQAYMRANGNSPGGQLVTRYIGAVNTLKEEFANLAQGGYAPTEPVWKLANEQINGDYGVKQMGASLDEIQRLIRYRVQAIPGAGAVGPNAPDRYTGQTGGPPASGVPGPRSTGSTAPPPAAVQALKGNPSLADQFDAKYGPGAAKAALGN